MKRMNSTILVTGGAGFIGSNFVLSWMKAGGGSPAGAVVNSAAAVVNLDLLTYAGNAANLASVQNGGGGDDRYTFVRGDICDAELVGSLLRKYQPRAIVHFAAESHVDRSIVSPEGFIRTNVVGTFTLLEQARVYWNALGEDDRAAFRFLHVSTDEVYGTLGPDDAAFSEETAYAPNSPYAASKAGSDHLARAYFHTFHLPVLTDVHTEEQVVLAAAVVDVLQIPAFLCRQTDLIAAAARSGKIVNLKKGQFLSPLEMGQVVRKAVEAGGRKLLVTERGTTFGYHNLVSDMRSIPILRTYGYPVIFDATHSVQLPGAGGDRSGGQREMAPVLARCALAAGADGLFIETHPNPDKALSDGPNMIRLDNMAPLLAGLVKLRALANCWPMLK